MVPRSRWRRPRPGHRRWSNWRPRPCSRTITHRVCRQLAVERVRRAEGDRIELWRRPLAVGGVLPVLPLGLRNAGVVPVDLEATYNESCRRSRLPL